MMGERNDMKIEMLSLLRDLADVLEKHGAGIFYTRDDDGIHVTLGGDWETSVGIGWPGGGDLRVLRAIIAANERSNNQKYLALA